jgi:hypothetical protein
LGGGKGNWEEGGVQYTANQGPEWTGIRATTQRRDFQVSKGRVPRVRGGTRRGYQKGAWGMHLYVYIMLMKDCV